MRTVTMPRYLTRFACIGSACEDNCCAAGWNVPVDAQTYSRYRTLGGGQLAEELRAHVQPNPPNVGGEEDFARIQMGANGCPFLTSERLCNIQLRLGEEMLGNTCASYPRVSLVTDDAIDRAALLSCPEAARLALLDPEALDLVERQEPDTARMAVMHRASTDLFPPGDVHRHFRGIRREAADLLRRTEVSLEARLLTLGLVLRQLTDSAESSASAVRATFESYAAELPLVQQQVAAMTPNHALQLELLRELLVMRVAMGGIGSPRYRSCVERVARGLGLRGDEPTSPAAVDEYARALVDVYAPYVQSKPYVLPNFLANQIYASLFPFADGRSPFEDYLTLVIRYGLLKLHLVGVGAAEGQLADDVVVEVVQSLQKAVDHAPQYLGQALELVRKRGGDNVGFVALLIVA